MLKQTMTRSHHTHLSEKVRTNSEQRAAVQKVKAPEDRNADREKRTDTTLHFSSVCIPVRRSSPIVIQKSAASKKEADKQRRNANAAKQQMSIKTSDAAREAAQKPARNARAEEGRKAEARKKEHDAEVVKAANSYGALIRQAEQAVLQARAARIAAKDPVSVINAINAGNNIAVVGLIAGGTANPILVPKELSGTVTQREVINKLDIDGSWSAQFKFRRQDPNGYKDILIHGDLES